MRNNQNEGKNMAVVGEVGRLGCEASVMKRMHGRSGAYTPSGSKGIAHEIMANDWANLNNLLKPDTVTWLTKSSNAPQVDAVTMKGGKVLERIQYKDTTSPSGVQKTVKQVASGKYR